MTTPDPTPPRKNRLLRFAPVAVILAALGAMYAAGLQDIFNLDWLAAQRGTLRTLIADHYALSLISFALIYVLAVATAFPAASMLTISGGV
ncbi:MAG: TVP38/TMEM64 family protein, partial [Proteobacteria bacterium]|nr:TVP38/TMEM64 family protein [Pseudomonadota bacterium]